MTVVIPTYNERENLPRIIGDILGLGPDYTVLIVDDNSPDGTGEVAESMARNNPGRVIVLHRPGKSGMGTAYVAGFKRALATKSRLIFQMDADYSHHPRFLETLREATDAADMVIGSRYVEGGRGIKWSWRRALLSRFGCLYARILLRLPIRDVTGGFKCFRREVLMTLDLDSFKSSGFAFQIEMNHAVNHHGFRIAEVPIVFEDRLYGHSKIDSRIIREGFAMVLKLRFGRGWSGSRQPHHAPVGSTRSGVR